MRITTSYILFLYIYETRSLSFLRSLQWLAEMSSSGVRPFAVRVGHALLTHSASSRPPDSTCVDLLHRGLLCATTYPRLVIGHTLRALSLLRFTFLLVTHVIFHVLWLPLDTADGSGIHGLPHAAVDDCSASSHARHRPPEKSTRVATIALPHGFLLVS